MDWMDTKMIEATFTDFLFFILTIFGMVVISIAVIVLIFLAIDLCKNIIRRWNKNEPK